MENREVCCNVLLEYLLAVLFLNARLFILPVSIEPDTMLALVLPVFACGTFS